MFEIIVNPKALRGKGAKLLGKIEDKLRAHSAAYRIHRTERAGQATELARTLSEQNSCNLVVMGGDGTLNDVLNGICDTSACNLGLIPAGTGNDFAAAAAIPKGLDAVDLLLKGNLKFTDYLQFGDGRRSLNIAGLGMDVDILQRCERKKFPRGKGKYFFSLLQSLAKYRGCRFKVKVNGRESEHNALIAAVCNGTQLGGGIPLCPPAVIDDGKLELVIVDYPKRSKLLGALVKLMKGKVFDVPFAKRVTAEEVEIIPAAPCMAQYDGELYEVNNFHAKLVSGKLRMFRG